MIKSKNGYTLFILYCLFLSTSTRAATHTKKEALLTAIAHNNPVAAKKAITAGKTKKAWYRAAKTGNPVLLRLLDTHDCKRPKDPTKLLKRLIKTGNPKALKTAFDIGLYNQQDLLTTTCTRYKDGQLIRPTKKVIALLDKQKQTRANTKNFCGFCYGNLPEKLGESISVGCPKRHRLCTDCFDTYTQSHHKKNTGQAPICLTCIVEL